MILKDILRIRTIFKDIYPLSIFYKKTIDEKHS